YEGLVQICGPVVKATVTRGDDDGGGSTFTMPQVRAAIAMMAGYRRITDECEVGFGCWQGLRPNGSPDDCIILVGAGRALVWNEIKGVEQIETPRYGGRLLNLDSSVNWCDFDEIGELIQSCDQAAAESATSELGGILKRWKWKHNRESPI